MGMQDPPPRMPPPAPPAPPAPQQVPPPYAPPTVQAPPTAAAPPPPPAFPPPPPYEPPSPTVTAPELREPADPGRAGPDVAFTPVRQHAKLVKGAPWGLLVLTLLAIGGVLLDPNLVTVLILVAAAAGTLSAWALALARPGPRVTITRGILEVRTFDSHRVFDLTAPTTRLTIVGHPDAGNWRVEIARRRLDPYVLDGRTVDPHEFTAAVWPYVPAGVPEQLTPDY